MSKLNIGDSAPDFSLKNQNGDLVSLSEFQEKKHVVLYFYPKDDTPGCTKEACGFRDSYEDFVEIGAEVIGVSADSVRSHQSFATKRRLPFLLLSDPDNAVRKEFGVSGSLMGLFPGRETFVIDKNGKIRHRFSSQFNIDRHIKEAKQILENL